MSRTDLEACVVRIESEDGQIIGGTGFVIGSDLAVTCAHVVEAVGVGPNGFVRVTFQVNGETANAEILADGWHPDQDVAFLQLSEAL